MTRTRLIHCAAALIVLFAATVYAATTYQYVAQTAATVRTSGTIAAAGINWNCTGNRCTTAGPWPTPSVAACQALAKQVGAIIAYGHKEKMLSPAELQQCNAGVTHPGAVGVPRFGQLPTLPQMPAAGKAADAAKSPVAPAAPASTGSGRVTLPPVLPTLKPTGVTPITPPPPGIGTLPSGVVQATPKPAKLLEVPPALFQFVTSQLHCPAIPALKSKARFVGSPIDEKKGDCALVGKGVEIENYLKSLEILAAECKARIAESWSNVQKAKANLDTEIDALPGEAPPSFSSPMLCDVVSSAEPAEPAEPLEFPEEGNYYTNWLKRIGKDAVKFCRLVDELVKPLKKSCDEMNKEIKCLIESHQGVSDATKTAMHQRLAWSMNAATINYGYLDFFYSNTLNVSGWGNFRKSFNESTLRCGPTLRLNQPPRGEPRDIR